MDGNFEDIGPTTGFTCTKCHWHTWQFSTGEPRTQAFRSGAEDSTDWGTAPGEKNSYRSLKTTKKLCTLVYFSSDEDLSCNFNDFDNYYKFVQVKLHLFFNDTFKIN